MFELRRPERWRRWWQGAVSSVHAALCGNPSGHGNEQQVGGNKHLSGRVFRLSVFMVLLQQYCVNRISSNIQQPSAFKHRCDCSSELTRKAWAFLLYMFPLQVSLKKKIKKNPTPLGKTVTILLYPFTFFGFGLSVCQQNNDERILLKISGNADNDSRNRTAVSKNASSKSHFVGKCAAWQRSALYKSAFYGVIP